MYLRAALSAVALIVLMGAGWKCYVMGEQSIQRKWDAEKAAMVLAEIDAKEKLQQAADSVAKTVHQAARRERVVYRTITKEVARVQNDCPMSDNFRLLHDSAATATVPDFSAARTDGASVTAQDVAETVVENYDACRDNSRRLEGLQSIIRSFNGS